MGRPIKKDTADVSTVIRIIDSTAGTPETAVEHDTSGIDLWYRREGATKTSITEVALAALDSAHSDGGIEHIGDGYYRLDLPDAACATGSNGVMVGGTVTGMIVIGNYHTLVDYDPYDSVRAGLTALPNAAADAAGGLPISDLGGLDIDSMNTNISSILTDTGTTLQAELDGIQADTEDIQTQIGTAGAGLTAVPWNPAWDTEVQSECTDALSDYDGPTNAEMEARTLAAASYATAANQTTIEGKVDTVDTVVDAIKSVTDNLPDSGALTTLLANVVAILADTNELQTAFFSAFAEVTSKPAAGAGIASKQAFQFHAAVNKGTFNKTTGVHTMYQSNGSGTLGTRDALIDDGITLTTPAVT